MNKEKIIKITIVVVIALSILGIFIFKSIEKSENDKKSINNIEANLYSTNLPTLVEFGSTTCEPCKTMVPILKKVKNDYKDKLVVSNIDVYKDSINTRKYNIRVTPTQIFFDTEGKVIYRHEGVLYEDKIVEKLIEMGVK